MLYLFEARKLYKLKDSAFISPGEKAKAHKRLRADFIYGYGEEYPGGIMETIFWT